MEIYLPFIVIFLLLQQQVRQYKKLCKYLSATYPSEWQKLTQYSLGTTLFSITNAAVGESIKTGFFSTVEDKQIQQFKKFKMINISLLALMVALQLAMLLFKAAAV